MRKGAVSYIVTLSVIATIAIGVVLYLDHNPDATMKKKEFSQNSLFPGVSLNESLRIRQREGRARILMRNNERKLQDSVKSMEHNDGDAPETEKEAITEGHGDTSAEPQGHESATGNEGGAEEGTHEEGTHEEGHGTGEGEEHHSGHHMPGEGQIVYFVFGGLLIGGLAREFKKSTGLPYTPIQLVIGILLGGYTESLGDFGKAIDQTMEINPHGILMIFIPTILFESAFNSDNYTFKKCIWQAILQAGPGVVIGALLLALSWNVLLGYSSEFPMTAALTFSSIACATDPVAVVALLKELGTSIKFNILLEGESLLNDGTAMVFYLVFASMYKAQGVTFFGIITQFVQLSIGGPILGAIACFLTILWLRRIVKDEQLTISITFISCYLTFFFAEGYLGASGILAIVTLGVLMGAFGRVKINPESEHAVHSVWSFIQFVLETLIFLITGCFIGKTILMPEIESTIGAGDWVRMFIFFILMTLVRYIMVQIMCPLLNTTGYPIGQKDLLVQTYGGLRGAIALALALMVSVDEDYPRRFRELVLFYLVGMIVLTILINGLTIKYLIDKIGFNPVNRWREKVRETLEKNLVITSIQQEEVQKNNKFLKLADWSQVEDLIQMKRATQNISNLLGGAIRELIPVNQQGEASDYTALNKDQGMIETRLRFYKLLKAQIWERFEESLIGGDTVNNLNEIVDLCFDELDRKLWIWECASDRFQSTEKINRLIDWKDNCLVGKIARNWLNSGLLDTYETVSCLILCFHEQTEHKPNIPMHQEFIDQLYKEIEVNNSEAETYLYNLGDLYPELIKSIQNKQAAHMIMNRQKHEIDSFQKQGIINEDEYDEIRGEINAKINNLDYTSLAWDEHKRIDAFTMISPIFSKLSTDMVAIVKNNLVAKHFTPGTKLYSKGERTQGVYVITKGIVEDVIEGEAPEKFNKGFIQNYANYINKDHHALSTLTAVNDVDASFLPNETLKKICEQSTEHAFVEQMYKHSLRWFMKSSSNYNDRACDCERINEVSATAIYRALANDQLITLRNGGFLFSGELKIKDENFSEVTYINQYDEPTLIRASDTEYVTTKATKLLQFTIPVEGEVHTDGDNRMLGLPARASIRNNGPKPSILVSIENEKNVDRLYQQLIQKKGY